MLVEEAHELLARIFHPQPFDSFLGEALDRSFVRISGHNEQRAALLGPNPEQLILGDFDRLSRSLRFHSKGATGPPPELKPARDADEFRCHIRAFQERGYTVRLEKVHDLSPGLREFVRALEIYFMAEVQTIAFWSGARARAPIHHDQQDMLIIQIKGRKRWTISTDSSDVPNTWAPQATGPERSKTDTLDLAPGEMIYIPRGTRHSVEALEESLHISVALSPLTLREALIACIDLASDLNLPMRRSFGANAGERALSIGYGDLMPDLSAAAGILARHCTSPEFVNEALRRRACRVVRAMQRYGSGEKPAPDALQSDSVVRRRRLASCQVSPGGDRVEVTVPGSSEFVHASTLPALNFMAHTSAFRIDSLPGEHNDVVRVALVRRFIENGLLELDTERTPSS